ncbi:MAG: UDP-N-acetylmuramate--L-alanine ligase [Planctomycetota bacterium]
MQANQQVASPRGVVECPRAPSVPHVHIVGCAGTGLSAIARLFRDRGLRVSGSELVESPVLESLRESGVECWVGHSSRHVDGDTSFVVISAAVRPTNPEVQAALRRRIPILKYAECLGRLMAEKEGIAVAGTHGKTTTTAMVSWILECGGLDPTFVVGGDCPTLGGRSRSGRGPHFVAEACEYDRSFLHLRPRYAVVTNIEEEHLDYYPSLKEIQAAFSEFASRLPEQGYLVVNRDDANSNYLSEFCRSAVGTFSLRPRGADWWAEDIDYGRPAGPGDAAARSESGPSFRMVGPGAESALVRLRIPGAHNVANALAAAAVCRRIGVPLEAIAEALGRFGGVRRRFEILADGPVVVVDDYAHHPTEVLTVLRAARQRLAGRRLIAVFQPHQHARLKRFRSRFADVLARFDAALVLDVYAARDAEEDIETVSSQGLVEAMRETNPQVPALYTPDFESTLRALRRHAREGDAVIFLGAGSVTDLAKRYAAEASRT